MDEMTKDLIAAASDLICNTIENLNDIKEVLEKEDSPINRVVIKNIDKQCISLITKNKDLMKKLFEQDERSRLIPESSIFKSSTWYEHIQEKYYALTGFVINDYQALLWTLGLVRGIDTFTQLVKGGKLKQDEHGQVVYAGTKKEAEEYGYNYDRIKQLEKHNFAELAFSAFPVGNPSKMNNIKNAIGYFEAVEEMV